MFGFDSAISGILGDLGQPTISIQVIPIEAPVNQRFEDFKLWAIGYVQEHDSLEPHHQTIQQIPNMASADDLEQLLRHNHNYCDDCLLKMYRKYAIEEQEVEETGCGDEYVPACAPIEDGEEEQEDSFAKAGSACADMLNQEEEPPAGGG